jgi:hypothetical protein
MAASRMRFIVAICSSVQAPVAELAGVVNLSVIDGAGPPADEFCALTAAPTKQQTVMINGAQRHTSFVLFSVIISVTAFSVDRNDYVRIGRASHAGAQDFTLTGPHAEQLF